MARTNITTLFLDIGGVLLTNGWDRTALDVSQSLPDQVAYIDDRPLFVETANSLGIQGILHFDVPSTRIKLAALGL